MFSREDYRMPAEWEAQSGVQLTWPHAGTDWAPMLQEITTTYEEMAREISKREPLLIVAPEGTQECSTANAPLDRRALATNGTQEWSTVRSTKGRLLPAGRKNGQCSMVNAQWSMFNTNDTWARDHGFITLVPTQPSTLSPQPSPLLLDFQFNGWGAKFPAELDNAINRHLYDEGRVRGQYVDCLDFVLEGGSIESDGQGTIFTTTGCLMAPHRNQPLTKDEIEARLLQTLCAKRIVWIDHGHLVGDDTDGHIDTLVRICPDDTLLYMSCDDPQDEQYEDLRLMAEELSQLRTLDGRPYRLMALPSPRPIYDDGDRLPATYANFLIINGAVLVPTYAQPDLDREACRIIGEAFPDREIVPIDSRSIIRQHGSIHCCTMQFPEGALLPNEK